MTCESSILCGTEMERLQCWQFRPCKWYHFQRPVSGLKSLVNVEDWMQTGARRYVQDLGYTFASLAISALVQFVLRIFLAHYMGDSDLGLYTLTWTIYSFAMIFAAFGIGQGITKYVAESREDTPRTSELLTSGLIASFAIGCLMALVLYASASVIADRFFHMPELAAMLRIVSIVVPFIAVEKATLGFLNGLRRMRLFAIINISQNVLIVVLTLVLALRGYGLKGATWGLVLPTVVVSLYSVFNLRDSVARTRLSSLVTALKPLLIFGVFVVAANAVAMIETQVDAVMIGHYMTAADVGVYAAAVTLSQAILLPSRAVQVITGPTMATFWGKGDKAGIEKEANDVLKYTAVFIIPMAFVAIMLGPDLLRVLFGKSFMSATDSLSILLIGTGFSATWAGLASTLSSTAFVRVAFILSSVSMMVNLLLNALLVPHFGINGAATATSIASFLGGLLQLYCIQRLVGIRFRWKWLLGIGLFTSLLGGGCYALSYLISPYICLLIFLVLCAAVFPKVFLGREDLASFKQLISRNREA